MLNKVVHIWASQGKAKVSDLYNDNLALMSREELKYGSVLFSLEIKKNKIKKNQVSVILFFLFLD